MKKEIYLKNQIIKIGKLLYDKNLISGTQGNISIKLSKDKILITPSGVSKGFLNLNQIITINSKGEKINGKLNPSSEWKMHLQVYKIRKDIQSVIHSHPIFVTLLSLTQKKFLKNILPEPNFTKIPVASYAKSGTAQLVKSIKHFIKNYDIIILKKHGLLVYNKDIFNAFFNTEIIEQYAKIYTLYFSYHSGKF